MSNDIGMLIGKVTHAFNITNHGKEKVQVSVTLDFTTSSDADIKSWLASNRVIAGQRSWRALSKGELEELDNRTFLANAIGRKVKSRAEQIAVYVNMGLPETLAELAVDNPTKFQEAMHTVETETETE